MNSWDEDPDELLRQRWQQTFADFEVQSRTSLRRRVLGQVTARNHLKLPVLLAGGALLLLISTILVYTIHRSNRPASPQSRITNVQLAPSTQSGRVTVRQPAIPVKPTTLAEQSEIGLRVNGSITRPQQTDREAIISNTKIGTVEGSSRRSMQLTTRLRLRKESNMPLVESYHPGRPLDKSPHFSNTRFPITSSPSVKVNKREWVEVSAENLDKIGNGASDPIAEDHVLNSLSATTAWPVVFAQLEIPKLSALPSSLRALPGQIPSYEFVGHPADAAENRVNRHKQWFVEAVPLSSFQWMTSSSSSTAYLTQVNAPAAFSPATWGYQINGGLRWQRWQAYLSIGQLRRWAYYTVNENRYRMESGPTNSYQLVREKHVVAENVALPMVGVGLSQYRLLGQGRYVVELGSQVAYSPMGGQTLASLRGGASRRLPVGRRHELQAGLTTEYGLTRLTNEQQQLVIHPIVVGISVRIQPRLYSKEQ
ncbi:hypothetical protein M0L20_23035 [Spirosoma sp. RP8]|uniref:Outer membrane beta-barrel protein n=1 Tax=Spirosoma liriopis TaxID=2937440 RepID=A0ABT0HRF3_9BACT|nr:hypothetical protein [Spirosoma liriopis]MCK8494762.1 hypothetical protein [Spirosoma liriopis]